MNKIFYLFLLLVAIPSFAKTLRVAVIDTGIDVTAYKDVLCKDVDTNRLDFTGTGMSDRHGHGTFVVDLIKKNAGASDYCLLVLKYFEGPQSMHINQYLGALKEAVRLNADIVNYSGGASLPLFEEYKIMASHKNVLFIAAAGNNSLNMIRPKMCFFPACYNLKNVISVGALSKNGSRSRMSNYGSLVKAWERGEFTEMSGTSMATAVHTGKVIYEKSHY